MVLEYDRGCEVGKVTHREAIAKVADKKGILRDKTVFLKKEGKSSRVIGSFNTREDGFMQVGTDARGWACVQEWQEIEKRGRKGFRVSCGKSRRTHGAACHHRTCICGLWTHYGCRGSLCYLLGCSSFDRIGCCL
jgi:hypothetical protein